MQRDRVFRKLREIMLHVKMHVVEGENTVHREVLETVFELNMGWSDRRTHNRWIELLVKHRFLSTKKRDLVFYIVDQDDRSLESFGAPKVTVKRKA